MSEGVRTRFLRSLNGQMRLRHESADSSASVISASTDGIGFERRLRRCTTAIPLVPLRTQAMSKGLGRSDEIAPATSPGSKPGALLFASRSTILQRRRDYCVMRISEDHHASLPSASAVRHLDLLVIFMPLGSCGVCRGSERRGVRPYTGPPRAVRTRAFVTAPRELQPCEPQTNVGASLPDAGIAADVRTRESPGPHADRSVWAPRERVRDHYERVVPRRHADPIPAFGRRPGTRDGPSVVITHVDPCRHWPWRTRLARQLDGACRTRGHLADHTGRSHRRCRSMRTARSHAYGAAAPGGHKPAHQQAEYRRGEAAAQSHGSYFTMIR